MFRRKEEDAAVENDASVNTAKEVKTDSESKTETSSTASPAPAVAATPTPAATATPAAVARPAEQKVAPMTQPTSNYRPAAPAPAARPAGMAPAAAADMAGASKKRILTVGNDILLKGEIATCDRLVIEGAVDAKLNDVHTVEIAETGSFKGSAQIEDAEISGLFEGDLVVRNRLIIYSTGKVRGKITYGEIEIERGGELTGEIKTGTSAAADKAKDKESKAA